MKSIFMLAPMAGLSHRALRELIEGFGGCDEYYSEMIGAGPLLGGGPFEKWYIDSGPAPEKFVYQVGGNDAAQIARAAAFLDRRGCLGIDINMGCSAPAIVRSGAGVRWMRDIDAAGNLIRLVRPCVKGRLSVKLRLGPGNLPGKEPNPGPEEAFEYLIRFCKRLAGEGVELVTLHPRLGNEKFRRLARWDYVERLRAEAAVPVAGNGDIASPADLCLRAPPGCAAMAGRGAVRSPWLFAHARSLEAELRTLHSDKPLTTRTTQTNEFASEKSVLSVRSVVKGGITDLVPVNIEDAGLRFLELLARYQPPEFHISRARRFFSYFCDNVTWAHHLYTLLNREESLSGLEQVWRRYFREQANDEEKRGCIDKEAING